MLGLAAYVALLVGAVLLLRDLHRRDPALALGLAAVLLVLFVHALIYEGFFRDRPRPRDDREGLRRPAAAGGPSGAVGGPSSSSPT